MPVLDFDMEKVIGTFLHDHNDISALNVRVASSIPTSFTRPWVKVNQLNATNVTNGQPEHLVEYYLQLDCYAGDGDSGREQASEISRTVRNVLKAAEGDTISDVVVTHVTFTSHLRLPDTAFEPVRERYVLDALIRCHA